MSGLLGSIARRRRPSASSRLGPPPRYPAGASLSAPDSDLEPVVAPIPEEVNGHAQIRIVEKAEAAAAAAAASAAVEAWIRDARRVEPEPPAEPEPEAVAEPEP